MLELLTQYELDNIIKYISLPDLLRLSQTCIGARYLKPEFFNMGRKFQFHDGIIYVNDINYILSKCGIEVYQKYRHYFPRDAIGYSYYLGIPYPNLFDMIEAAKNDDIQYIINTNYVEDKSWELSDMEYYNHSSPDYKTNLEIWHANNWYPCSVWNIFWWYGGPQVKEYLKIYADPTVEGPCYNSDYSDSE